MGIALFAELDHSAAFFMTSCYGITGRLGFPRSAAFITDRIAPLMDRTIPLVGTATGIPMLIAALFIPAVTWGG